MSKALAFAAGLGSGYINEARYQDRQELLDREMALRESEYQARKAIADEQLRRLQDEGKLKAALADATKQAEVKQSTTLDTGDGAKVYDMPAGVDSQDVASSDARQFKRNAETTGAEAAPPKIDSATTVNGKAYDNHAAGLKAAKEYNDPAARTMRTAGVLDSFGRPDAAMEYRSKAEKFRNDMYEAGRSLLFQKGSDMIGAGDFQGLAQAYAGYKDGRSAVFEPSGKGGQFVIYDDATKKEIGRIPITGNPNADVLTWQRVVYPDRAAEAAAAAERERNKPYTLKPGEQRFAGETRLNENPNLTSADARVATAGLGGSHGSAKSGAGEKPFSAPKSIAASFDGNKELIAAAEATYGALMRNNAGANEDDAANLAVRLTRDPAGVKVDASYDPSTGTFQRHVVDSDAIGKDGRPVQFGSQRVFKLGDTPYDPRFVSDAQAKDAVAKLVGSMKPEDAKRYKALPADYFASKLKEVQDALPGAISAANGDATRLQEIDSKYAAYVARLQAEQRNADLIKRFYEPPKEKPAPGSAPSPKAGLQAGLGSAMPLSEWRLGRPVESFR